MSGYLEVKYPSKSNLGLNPFKSWKRQWCILRPSPTFSGGVLAVYCSEAGAAAGTIEIPAGFVVRRAKSRTRPYAFAVFPTDEPRKPRVLLAASTVHDAQVWMEKIKVLINGSNLLESEGSIKDSFSVTVTATELSRKCGISGADSTVTLTTNGVLVSHPQRPVLVNWQHISDASLITENGGNGTCVLTIDSGFAHGGGSLRFSCPGAAALARALRRSVAARGALARALSKSDTELGRAACSDTAAEVRRSRWYSIPSEFSMDDLDLLMSKEPAGALSRSRAAPHLPAPAPALACAHRQVLDDSTCDRRSVASVSSGIYEEIEELPPAEGGAGPGWGAAPPSDDGIYCKMSRDRPLGALKLKGVEASIRLDEPTYESVSECVYATLRRPRRAPPPLPPRVHTPLCGPGAGMRAVPRTGSLGCLPPAAPAHPPGGVEHPPGGAAHTARTLPRWDRSRHAFSAFRKRLKSDSRTITSPKSETKDKDVETKKKKFELPTRDIFKSFKVSRKMKNLKIASGTLSKGETKSCEFLDDTEHVKTNRCSKSVERLEGNDEFLDEFDTDSIEFEEHSVAALSLPQEIVDLIMKEHEKLTQICGKETEGDYTPMSPIVPPTLDHHYIVMSPRTNMA